ncbi:MAG: hypothetical protein NUV77_25575 [Thermoguttaceae bacterium]|nr:hypothetical protein [Thermoguttaceae bacterium]
MAWPSLIERANGFSENTSLPALAAMMHMIGRQCSGAAITTPSTSGRASTSRKSRYAAQPRYWPPALRGATISSISVLTFSRTPRRTSLTAKGSTSGRPANSRTNWTPRPPGPMNATPMRSLAAGRPANPRADPGTTHGAAPSAAAP